MKMPFLTCGAPAKIISVRSKESHTTRDDFAALLALSQTLNTVKGSTKCPTEFLAIPL
jgi:hypothetical protein